MIDDTALWAWFVFDSGLPTQRAKVLLEAWQAEGSRSPLRWTVSRLRRCDSDLQLAKRSSWKVAERPFERHRRRPGTHLA